MSNSVSRGRSRRFLVAATAVTLGAGTALTATALGASASGQAASTYIVLARDGAAAGGASRAVTAAGGTVVASYDAIGVVIARSSSADFAATVSGRSGIQGVSATAGFATKVGDTTDGASDATSDTAPAAPAAPTTWGDSLSGLQWDMRQIKVPEAQAINAGSSSVLVGDIDTGLDFTHPDLAPVYDAANSTDCTSGASAPLAIGNDANGHGTHTAGTIAAAANGTGIVGVAPGVRIAGIRAGDADGFFFPEAVVCSFMWAATHGVTVTNNSYFADPYLFNCKNDPVQRAIWEAERRAIRYAQARGVTVVAAQGNFADDLSHPTMDNQSPDNTTPVDRTVTNACAVVPVEVSGVVGVTATGNLQMKSFYSSYGISTADVAAPGGDSILQRTAASPNGRVLSDWPLGAINNCLASRRLFENGSLYCYQQGTSMASPHAVGVAALIASTTGARGGALAAALTGATNSLSCPADVSMYAFFPSQLDLTTPQTCSGGVGHNSWFGSGEVDAFKAVSH
ncbi:peptidase S8 [Intrasporangium oryzae NRRL B-24470]|uniref:Peptidase S8 n=1 Tax=Intrasporangium oryzae NRRL B-24470 TaxID=1386089 RepID=W9GAG8_9MICO|nr:S8 family serine peptidase [Intrasporangium oryzae]EWT03176.1 peptidase S8 [Intrasporangium oryzae NRRL B-24470]